MSLTNDIDHNHSVNAPHIAGKLRQFVSVWQTITSDYSILSSIRGVKIEFVAHPKQTLIPREYNFNRAEVVIIDKQIEKFLQTGVIETTSHCKGEYISNIFIRPKKDGSYRLILNLKNLNQFVQYHHFKMENLKSAITLMSPNCYMASIDLKDAYYSVSIDTNHRKYLRFIWRNQLFQFTCLPNGLSSAPRIFTKLMKPAYSTLRCQGFENVGYIDDTYLKGSTFHACETNVSSTVKLFTDLGFTLNMAKSVLIPSQSITFLGFVLNSAQMTVALTPSKAMKVKSKAVELLHNQSPTIRTVSEMIGLMVASFPGVMYGPLYYRQLEIEKVVTLKQNQGNFEASMILSDMARSDLHWWIENITDASNTAGRSNCQLIVYSDASLTGWGGVFNSITTGGQWTEDESQNHINYLEILACFLTLKAFCSQIKNCHVKTMIDNTTAVSYINSMGGRSLTCNQITRELWVWCASHGIWLSAAHIPGKENVLADKESRKKDSDTEWKLNPELFSRIATLWGPVSIDLFASRLNYQLKPFVSWRPDPEAMAIDAFSLDWRGLCFYAFPPFSLINRVLQKVEQDQSQGIIIVPMWTTQVWFPRLLHLLIDFPVTIPKGPTTLLLPFNREKAHPLQKKLTLLACKLSGIPSQQEAFRKKLPKSYCNPGERVHTNNIPSTSGNGCCFAVQGVLIHTKQLQHKR